MNANAFLNNQEFKNLFETLQIKAHKFGINKLDDKKDAAMEVFNKTLKYFIEDKCNSAEHSKLAFKSYCLEAAHDVFVDFKRKRKEIPVSDILIVNSKNYENDDSFDIEEFIAGSDNVEDTIDKIYLENNVKEYLNWLKIEIENRKNDDKYALLIFINILDDLSHGYLIEDGKRKNRSILSRTLEEMKEKKVTGINNINDIQNLVHKILRISTKWSKYIQVEEFLKDKVQIKKQRGIEEYDNIAITIFSYFRELDNKKFLNEKILKLDKEQLNLLNNIFI
jgi:hypothetical protein